jgi:hypothetical protein
MAKVSGRNRYLRRGGGLPGGAGGGAAANPYARAQEMIAKAQADLAVRVVEGSAGGGAVRVSMSGDQKITGIKISPDVLDPDDVEILQDLILAAIADATDKASAMQTEQFASITGGLNIPGLS